MKYVICSYEDSLPLKNLKKKLTNPTNLLLNNYITLTGFETEALSPKEEEDILKEIPNAIISDSLPADWKPFNPFWKPVYTNPKTVFGLGEVNADAIEGLRGLIEYWVLKTGTKASFGGCQVRKRDDGDEVNKILSIFRERTEKEGSGVFVYYENSVPLGVISGSILTDGTTVFFSPDVTCYAQEGKNNIMRIWHRYVRPFCEAKGVLVRRSWIPKSFSNELVYCVHGVGTIWSNVDFPETPGNLGQNTVASTVEPDDTVFKDLVDAEAAKPK